MENVTLTKLHPRSKFDLFTKVLILRAWSKYQDIFYLASKFRCKPDRILDVIENRRLYFKTWQVAIPFKPNDTYPYHSPSFVAIELILAEWIRRARQNRINLTTNLFQRSTEFISGYVGYHELSYSIWNRYLENKYQIDSTQAQAKEDAFIVTEERPSMNFGDIFNDVIKYYGDNIIFPIGRPMHATSTTEDPKNTFDNPFYVTIEQILCEWVKHAQNNDIDITVRLLEKIAKYAATAINFVDFIKIPEWIDSFKCKYKISTTAHKKESKDNIYFINNQPLVIDNIINVLRDEFGSDIILPCTAARVDTTRTSRKRSRESSLSITVNNSNSTPMEVSNWITKTPGHIALELILSEWIKRTQHNGEAISQFQFDQKVRRFVSTINFNVAHSFSTDWLPIFKQKYKILFNKTPRLPKRDDKNRVSTIWNDIISDLCELYGESVIMARPGPQHELLDPCIAAEISRSHTAFQLIADEWMKRCRHNGFIITNYNLTAVTQSIASYLKCKSDRIISFWLRIAKEMFDKVDNPSDICPYKVKLQPTNVHLIIKDLYMTHGDEKNPSDSYMSVIEAREKRMCPHSAKLDDDSHLDGDAAKRIKEEGYDDSVPEIHEIRLSDDIETESIVEVYVTEDSTDASEFGQMYVVKTEPKLNRHENESTDASEFGQMDIVKTQPELSDHENASKQTSAKLDNGSRLDRDSAKRITKEGCRFSDKVEIHSHLDGDSPKRIKEEGYDDSVQQIQEIRLPDDSETESLVEVYVTEDSSDASEFSQMYVVKTEPELNGHENGSTDASQFRQMNIVKTDPKLNGHENASKQASTKLDDDSRLDGDPAKRITKEGYGDSVPQIKEIQLPDDIETESLIEVYVTEDSSDASEFGQMYVVETETELNGHENESTDASEFGQIDIVKTDPELSDHENVIKQTSAKLDYDSRLDRDSANRITKEGCRFSDKVEIHSHLDGDSPKRIKEEGCDDSVQQIQEIRLPDDIETESLVEVYVTEDSTDASEFGQICVVETETELNGHENKSIDASEFGQMNIVKTEPELSDHENASKQTSAKLDNDSRLDRDSAKRITKECCRGSDKVEVDSHLNGDSPNRIKEGYDDGVQQIQEVRLPEDMETESHVDVYVTEDSTDTSEFGQMYVVKTEPELNGHENASKLAPTIGNYHDAIEYLQPLERFLFTNEDMRAVGLINQLENMLKDRI